MIQLAFALVLFSGAAFSATLMSIEPAVRDSSSKAFGPSRISAGDELKPVVDLLEYASDRFQPKSLLWSLRLIELIEYRMTEPSQLSMGSCASAYCSRVYSRSVFIAREISDQSIPNRETLTPNEPIHLLPVAQLKFSDDTQLLLSMLDVETLFRLSVLEAMIDKSSRELIRDAFNETYEFDQHKWWHSHPIVERIIMDPRELEVDWIWTAVISGIAGAFFTNGMLVDWIGSSGADTSGIWLGTAFSYFPFYFAGGLGFEKISQAVIKYSGRVIKGAARIAGCEAFLRSVEYTPSPILREGSSLSRAESANSFLLGLSLIDVDSLKIEYKLLWEAASRLSIALKSGPESFESFVQDRKRRGFPLRWIYVLKGLYYSKGL